MQREAVRRWSAEIDGFERLLDALSALRGRDDAARLRELVRLRPELASRIGALRDTGMAALSGVGDGALASDYRTRLSAVQRQTLLLQADWPVPYVTTRPEEYAKAAAGVAQDNRAFVAWARDALARAG